MLYGVHTCWIMLTSLLDYISFTWWDLIFVFKWLNPNHFPSLCDCHSLSLRIRVKRFSVLIATGCLPTNLVYIIIQRLSWFSEVGEAICALYLKMSENNLIRWVMPQLLVASQMAPSGIIHYFIKNKSPFLTIPKQCRFIPHYIFLSGRMIS